LKRAGHASCVRHEFRPSRPPLAERVWTLPAQVVPIGVLLVGFSPLLLIYQHQHRRCLCRL